MSLYLLVVWSESISMEVEGSTNVTNFFIGRFPEWTVCFYILAFQHVPLPM